MIWMMRHQSQFMKLLLYITSLTLKTSLTVAPLCTLLTRKSHVNLYRSKDLQRATTNLKSKNGLNHRDLATVLWSNKSQTYVSIKPTEMIIGTDQCLEFTSTTVKLIWWKCNTWTKRQKVESSQKESISRHSGLSMVIKSSSQLSKATSDYWQLSETRLRL